MEKTVSKHLMQCDACRLDFQRLSAADDAAVPAAPADDVNNPMVRLRGWGRSDSRPARNGAALKRRGGGGRGAPPGPNGAATPADLGPREPPGPPSQRRAPPPHFFGR